MCSRKKNPPGVWSVRKMGPGMEEMATEAFFGWNFCSWSFCFWVKILSYVLWYCPDDHWTLKWKIRKGLNLYYAGIGSSK